MGLIFDIDHVDKATPKSDLIKRSKLIQNEKP